MDLQVLEGYFKDVLEGGFTSVIGVYRLRHGGGFRSEEVYFRILVHFSWGSSLMAVKAPKVCSFVY